jgi:hypothetical protein
MSIHQPPSPNTISDSEDESTSSSLSMEEISCDSCGEDIGFDTHLNCPSCGSCICNECKEDCDREKCEDGDDHYMCHSRCGHPLNELQYDHNIGLWVPKGPYLYRGYVCLID